MWISVFVFLLIAFAEEPQKLQQFEVEWESKKDALAYDIKLVPKDSSKPSVTATTDKTVYKTEIAHGIYSFQVRAKYKSNNGNWSPPAMIKVLPIQVELIFPKHNDGVEVKVSQNAPVTFQWSEAQDAKQYRLRYWSDKNPKPVEVLTKKTTHTTALEIGPQYFWEIELLTKEGVQHENSSATAQFFLISGKLAPVVISDVKLDEGVVIEWQTLKDSESTTGVLSYRPLLGDTWTVVVEKVFLKENRWKVEQELIPGEYKIELTARAKNHHSSLPSTRRFFVKPKAPELQPIVATDL